MNRIKLGRPRRWGLYTASLGLWGSGAAWLIAHYYLMRQGEYGPETSPVEPWALEVHGAFAMVALWFLGLLWGVHVVKGWESRRGRWSGGLTLGMLLALVVTGYLLYYLGDEDRRAWASLVHWAGGLAMLPLFVWHRFKRKAASRRRDRASSRR